MTKRMLIDATHPEETRVVVLDGHRLEDFDVETATKKQLKGNIYLAKIVRVEPSLQAAFVEYGGSRHGFLAFGEIHPDYYQIPVADRQRLIAQQAEEAREAEKAEDEAAQAEEAGGPPLTQDDDAIAPADHDVVEAGSAEPTSASGQDFDDVPAEFSPTDGTPTTQADLDPGNTPAQLTSIVPDQVFDSASAEEVDDETVPEAVTALADLGLAVAPDGQVSGDSQSMAQLIDALSGHERDALGDAEDQPLGPPADHTADATGPEGIIMDTPPPALIGGTGGDDRDRSAPSPRYLRNYKIQEVIRRRQIMLVQVVKEERGGKGAALTTYISLAGRFSVLMPNSPRGGGISRKITSAADRRRLKEVTTELDLPAGMGLIVRTAGAARPKPEIKRDCEYLLQLWDDIRDTTMKAVAPAAIYEEASLIKRAIRDVYSRDVDEVQVDGEVAWRAARDQMRLLMPSHAHKVQLWQDPSGQKLFAHHQVDAQLDAMLSPTVQLKSGGYLVINQTEALVAIDVNSGRSTRERGIEETALRTNVEAAEEVARQLRLRDLAGLIVIDFIDMEIRRNNATVERKLTDALKNDRARIQLGSISHFGLMEMSRQRLRPSLAETSFVRCEHCEGTGLVRSTDGAAIHVLRAIEEEGGKRRSAEIMVHVAGPIAMYILNHKRDRLREIETRYGMVVLFTPDPTLLAPAVKIDRVRAHAPGEAPAIPAIPPPAAIALIEDSVEAEDIPDEVDDDAPAAIATTAEDPRSGETGEAGRRRRRRRRRGGRREEGSALAGSDEDTDANSVASPRAAPDATLDAALQPSSELDEASPADGLDASDETPTGAAEPAESALGGARRRGRRGGRRRRKELSPDETNAVDLPPAVPAYSGPTPADPFGGAAAFDIFDAIEWAETQAEQSAAAASQAPAAPPVVEPAASAAPVVPKQAAEPASVPEPTPELVEELPASPPPAKVARPRRGSRAALAAAALAEQAASAPAAVPEPEPAKPQPPEPESTVPEPDAAPPPEPAIRPLLVGEPPADAPRRGWWRR